MSRLPIGCFLVLTAIAACDDDPGSASGGGGAGGAGGAGGPLGGEGAGPGAGAGGGIDGGGGGLPPEGAGGDGGSGGVGVCEPGADEPCYSGPPETELVGLCTPGTRTCLDDGSAFGPCEGETLPTVETCTNVGDEDCDGMTNEEGADCVCIVGTFITCYSADPVTEGVGPCVAGAQICNTDGLGYGPCLDEVTPVPESCMTPGDDDCDGETDDDEAGCICTPNSVTSCYSGPPNTEGVAACTAGTHVCESDGQGYGPCIGEVTPTPELCTTAEDDDCDGVVMPACPGGDHLWSLRFGGSQEDEAQAVAIDVDGSVVVVGSATGDVDFGGGTLPSAGNRDIVIAKLDADGNHLWSRRYGDGQRQEGYAVAIDTAGNVIVTGNFQGIASFGGAPLNGGGSGGDVFLLKLDADGNHLWSQRFGTTGSDAAFTVATDAAGNVYIAGYFALQVNFGGSTFSGPDDAFVAKFGPTGNHVWSHVYGDNNFQSADKLAIDPAGGVVTVGSFRGTIDFGGGPLTVTGNAADTDIFVAKLDSDGNHVWSQGFGDPQYQVAHCVAVDAGGAVVLVGNFGGTLDFGGGPLVNSSLEYDAFVAKLAPDGSHVWSTHIDDPGDQQARAVTVDGAGNVVVAGLFSGAIDPGGGPLSAVDETDFFVAKLDPTGAHLWSHRAGTTEDQLGDALATDSVGNVIVGGRFQGDIDFGGGTLVSAGSYDGFLAKLSP